jgi:hypothetical protein
MADVNVSPWVCSAFSAPHAETECLDLELAVMVAHCNLAEHLLLQLHEQFLRGGSDASFWAVYSRMGHHHQPGVGHSQLCGACAGSFCKLALLTCSSDMIGWD